MKRVTVIVFALVALIACARNEETGTQVSARPVVREARAEKVTLKEVDRLYETAGSVQAETVSILSSKVMGEVTSIRVQVGEEVHKGQLLMTIDDSDISKKVQGAEAAYAEAASGLIMARENLQLTAATHERFKRLFDEKALTRQEMDEMDTKKRIAEAQVRQAEAMVQRSEASLQEARTHLGYARIVSPIDGIVSDKKIDLGTMASPGLPLLVIEDPSLYTININVDEQLFSRMKRGMRVSVSLSALGLETTGTVTEVAPAVDPATRTFLVKVRVKGKGLRSGLYATVGIPQGKTNITVAPAGAIVRRGQLTGVYTVDESRVITFRLIRTGREVDGMVEVLSGLSGGEMVIVSGADKAIDGGILSE